MASAGGWLVRVPLNLGRAHGLCKKPASTGQLLSGGVAVVRWPTSFVFHTGPDATLGACLEVVKSYLRREVAAARVVEHELGQAVAFRCDAYAAVEVKDEAASEDETASSPPARAVHPPRGEDLASGASHEGGASSQGRFIPTDDPQKELCLGTRVAAKGLSFKLFVGQCPDLARLGCRLLWCGDEGGGRKFPELDPKWEGARLLRRPSVRRRAVEGSYTVRRRFAEGPQKVRRRQGSKLEGRWGAEVSPEEPAPRSEVGGGAERHREKVGRIARRGRHILLGVMGGEAAGRALRSDGQ